MCARANANVDVRARSEAGRLLAFTSSELLLDTELVAMLGEDDRRESARRVDAYLVEERDAAAVTYAAYAAAAATGRAALAVFFKRAHRLGLIVGASIKSDMGLGNRRTTSGELHLDRCPLVFFALPRVNERAGAMSDVLVRVNVRPRFAVSGSGRVRYLGAQPPKGVVVAEAAPGTAACSAASAAAASLAVGRHTLSSVAEARWACHAHAAHAVHAVHFRTRRVAKVAPLRRRQGEPRDDQGQDGRGGLARGAAPEHGRPRRAGGGRLAAARHEAREAGRTRAQRGTRFGVSSTRVRAGRHAGGPVRCVVNPCEGSETRRWPGLVFREPVRSSDFARTRATSDSARTGRSSDSARTRAI